MGFLQTYTSLIDSGVIFTRATSLDSGIIFTNFNIDPNLDTESGIYYFSPLIFQGFPIFTQLSQPVSGAGSNLSAGITTPVNVGFDGSAVEDSQGNMYLTFKRGGNLAGSILKIDANTNSTGLFVGSLSLNGSTDGTTTGARFFGLGDMIIDSNDNLFLVDQGGRCIRKITPVGVVTTFAGTASNPSDLYVDGIGTNAKFPTWSQSKMTIDSDDNIYLVSAAQEARTLRKITPSANVTTIAGFPGSSGSQDGIGTSARFKAPSTVAIDSNKNIYVFDAGNYNLRKVTPDGIVTTFAGISGGGQICTNSEENPLLCDGIGTGAKFGSTTNGSSIIDQFNNLYFSQDNNIRKVNLNTSEVTTIAGLAGDIDGDISKSGTGFDVRFNYISSLKLDKTEPGVIIISNLEGQSVVKMKKGQFYSGRFT